MGFPKDSRDSWKVEHGGTLKCIWMFNDVHLVDLVEIFLRPAEAWGKPSLLAIIGKPQGQPCFVPIPFRSVRFLDMAVWNSHGDFNGKIIYTYLDIEHFSLPRLITGGYVDFNPAFYQQNHSDEKFLNCPSGSVYGDLPSLSNTCLGTCQASHTGGSSWKINAWRFFRRFVDNSAICCCTSIPQWHRPCTACHFFVGNGHLPSPSFQGRVKVYPGGGIFHDKFQVVNTMVNTKVFVAQKWPGHTR